MFTSYQKYSRVCLLLTKNTVVYVYLILRSNILIVLLSVFETYRLSGSGEGETSRKLPVFLGENATCI
jgi:hypothetical protein